MSEHTDGPSWQPPQDAGPGDAPEGERAGRTVDAAGDPPPPPPPPTAWPPPDPNRWMGGSGQDGSWVPPEPPGPRRGVVVAVVVGLLVLAVAAAGGLLALRGGGADEALVESELGELLDTIDRSERRMLAWQEDLVGVLQGPEADLADVADDVVAISESAWDDLTSIQTQLRETAIQSDEAFDGLQAIRDTYDEHMQAWIDYLDAVAGTPALALPDAPEARPFWDDIGTTADDFVMAVETRMPEDAPPDLVEQAEFILDRGFREPGEPSGDLVDLAG